MVLKIHIDKVDKLLLKTWIEIKKEIKLLLKVQELLMLIVKSSRMLIVKNLKLDSMIQTTTFRPKIIIRVSLEWIIKSS
jgi:hypothetical protein